MKSHSKTSFRGGLTPAQAHSDRRLAIGGGSCDCCVAYNLFLTALAPNPAIVFAHRPFARLLVVLLCAFTPNISKSKDNQIDSASWRIVVDGRQLVGPFATVAFDGRDVRLPLVPIAEMLGDQVEVNVQARTVTLARQDGVKVEFRAQTGEVRENGAPVLVSTGTVVQFTEPAESLRLPQQLVMGLLDASVAVDHQRKEVRIQRGVPLAAQPKVTRQGVAELYEARYSLTNSITNESYNFNAQLYGLGRILDGRTSVNLSFNGGTTLTPFNLNLVSIEHLRDNGQRLRLMDFSPGADLRFFQALIRGAAFDLPFSDGRGGSAFFGATPSGLSRSIGFDRFDTLIFGASFWFRREEQNPLSGAAGMMGFVGPGRRGGLTTGSIRYATRRLRIRTDFGFGGFEGQDRGDRTARGLAPFGDVAASYRPFSQLTFDAGLTHIGSEFLAPQIGGSLQPMNRVGGGASYTPFYWLSTSLRGRYLDRLTTGNDIGVTAGLSIRPPAPYPTLTVNHSQGTVAVVGDYLSTQVSLVQDWDRYRVTGDLVMNELGLLPLRVTGIVGASAQFGHHVVRASQAVSSGGALSGLFGWGAHGLLKGTTSMGAEFGYTKSGSQTQSFGRLLTSAALPWGQSIQLNMMVGQFGFQMMATLQGPLYRAPKLGDGNTISTTQIRELVTITGQVYRDNNQNGRFDSGEDEPAANVQVVVGGTHFAKTDDQGRYRVDNVKIGKREVRLDLLTVRADLTFLGSSEQLLVLTSGQDARVDFRLIRSGRVSGIVFLDVNGNGKFDEKDQPIDAVRMITGTKRDTLTDSDGTFLFGDLPPGEHLLIVDEKTLPEETELVGGPRKTHIRAGSETEGMQFPVRKKKRKVKVLEF